MPLDAQLQLYVFDTKARPVFEGTGGTWLTAKDRPPVDEAIAVLRQTAPTGGTSLYNAVAAAKARNPPPDDVLLLTDGLPTQGESAPRRRTVSGRDRLRLFKRSLEARSPEAAPGVGAPGGRGVQTGRGPPPG